MILHWLQKNNIPYILLSIILLILFYIWHKTFCLSLHYNVVNSYLFINGVAIYKSKAKDSEKKFISIVFRKHFKKFSTANMEKTGLYGCVYDFLIDFSIDVDNILDIHKYLMKKHDIK